MAEQYSVQAENLMKTAVEEYIDVLKDIKATDANLAVIRNIRISVFSRVLLELSVYICRALLALQLPS